VLRALFTFKNKKMSLFKDLAITCMKKTIQELETLLDQKTLSCKEAELKLSLQTKRYNQLKQANEHAHDLLTKEKITMKPEKSF